MLKQCLEVFDSELSEKGDKLILDNYVPADGTYVIVTPDGDSFKIKDIVILRWIKRQEVSIDQTVIFMKSASMTTIVSILRVIRLLIMIIKIL